MLCGQPCSLREQNWCGRNYLTSLLNAKGQMRYSTKLIAAVTLTHMKVMLLSQKKLNKNLFYNDLCHIKFLPKSAS